MARKQVAHRQRAIQKQVAKADRTRPRKENDRTMQAGARTYPAPPFPRQHQPKPGSESKLNPPPLYDAPFYVGSKKLMDKVALITGGDSGIGRAVAILFAREGADIVLAYLDEHQDAALTREKVEAEGRKCVTIPGDVRTQKYAEKAVARTIKEFGHLDVLVNNAAFQVHTSQLEDLTARHFEGIHAFTRSLSSQPVARGIRVNAVAPGAVWTPVNPSDKEAKNVSKFGADTPMKRPAQPEEIAPAYVFLASPQCSSYITGEILPIIGGYSGG
jgi:NAD(P)-dependent dehydrogenase (short-subunit alcohol dehydrogenase family)